MAFNISYSSLLREEVWGTELVLPVGGLTPGLVEHFLWAGGKSIEAFPLWLQLPLGASGGSALWGMPFGLRWPALHSWGTPDSPREIRLILSCSQKEGIPSQKAGRMFQQPGEKMPPANYQHLVNQLLSERTPARSHNTATRTVQDTSNAFLSQGREMSRQVPRSNLNQTSQTDKAEGFVFNSQ